MSRDRSTGTERQRGRWRGMGWPRASRWLRVRMLGATFLAASLTPVVSMSAAATSLGNRRVTFVGGGGSMYALDASRDNLPDAKRVLWRFDVDATHPTNHGEIESSPVVWTGAPGGPVVIFGADANQDSGFA